MKLPNFYRKIEKQNTAKKFGWKSENFSVKFYTVKGRIFPKSTKRHAKTPLFSGFFAVLVPRETDAENQNVTRETYNFNTHHNPVNSAFALEFYSLIITVYILETYVKIVIFFQF